MTARKRNAARVAFLFYGPWRKPLAARGQAGPVGATVAPMRQPGKVPISQGYMRFALANSAMRILINKYIKTVTMRIACSLITI
jgi:hypothetical protein